MTKSHSKLEDYNHIYMTMDDVMGYLRVKSSSTIYRGMESRGFPKPIPMGESGWTKRWDMAEVAEWVANSRSK